MQDLFERVREYYYQERGRGWEMNWEPHQIDLSDRWSCIAPRNKNDLRRMFVGTLLYAKAGLTSREEAEALFIEKNRLAGKIQDLGDYTLYTTKVDYAVVKDIEEDGEYVGFDVLLCYEPEQSAVEQAAASAAQRDRIRHVLHDGSPDAEKLRNRIGEQLVHSIALALQEMERVGLHHGHINPEHLMPYEHDGTLEFRLHIPGFDSLLKSDADDRMVVDYYSAPELINDSAQPFDVSTDLYSMGILLYQLLNEGKLPFESDTVSPDQAAQLRSQGTKEIPLPKHGCRLLQYIARKACAFGRVHRYANAADVLEDLKRIDSKVLTGYDPMEIVTSGGKVPAPNQVGTADARALQAARAEAEMLRAELARMKAEADSALQAAKACEALHREKSVLEVKNKQLEAKNKQLEAENKQLESKCSELEGACKTLEMSAIVSQKDRDDREAALRRESALRKENDTLKAACEQLRHELDDCRKQAEQAKAKPAPVDTGLQKKMQSFETQLAEARAELDAWQKRAEKWKNHAWMMYARQGSGAPMPSHENASGVTHEETMRKKREAVIDARFEQELRQKK